MAKEDVIKLPPVRVLKDLVAASNTTRSKTSTLNGAFGEKVAHAVEEYNVHAGAIKLCIKLQRMDAVKLMSFLSHFDDYREKLGINKLAASDLPGLDSDDDKPANPPVEEPPKGEKAAASKKGSDAPLKDDDPTGTGKPAPMFN